MEVSKKWIKKALEVLSRVGRDADKVVQPSRVEMDALKLTQRKDCPKI